MDRYYVERPLNFKEWGILNDLNGAYRGALLSDIHFSKISRDIIIAYDRDLIIDFLLYMKWKSWCDK